MVDLGAAAAFGDGAAVCGNLNPVAIMLQGAPEQAYAATHACLRKGGLRSLSAASCEIPDGSPPGNLDAQTRALWDC